MISSFGFFKVEWKLTSIFYSIWIQNSSRFFKFFPLFFSCLPLSYMAVYFRISIIDSLIYIDEVFPSFNITFNESIFFTSISLIYVLFKVGVYNNWYNQSKNVWKPTQLALVKCTTFHWWGMWVESGLSA